MPASAKLFLALGAALAACGVALGAFGAHALKARLSADQLALWNTATQYLFWHALGVLAVGFACAQLPDSAWLRTAGALLAAGIVLFSGSLYLLALGAPRGFGAVTPIGGLAFFLGWVALALGALRA
ncbi:MAG TPA: DUF423 domain-containing protein [Burkholderiales bacterium]|nr:DUF423 domain-containing protein [Burkholderiales bacterium]